MSKHKIINDPNDVKDDDKVIAIMGPTGSGKSNFIDHVTKSTNWSGSSLRSVTQSVRAIRIQLFNVNLVLVDTPGFDDTYRTDVTILELIGEWLKKTYKNKIELTGILFLHRITDNRMAGTAFRTLDMFGKLCGDRPAEKVMFVTTMWDKISVDKGEQREAELCSNYWRPMLELGARTGRFIPSNKACAQDIVKRLIDSDLAPTVLTVVPGRNIFKRDAGVTLFQEETVEFGRATVETQAAKTLYTQMQRLLSEHKKNLAELREAVKKTNNPQALADLEKEEARIQAELDKTFCEARKLKIPLGRRIQLYFSKQAKGRAIDFP